ncbi:procollagen-lysine,2-oxoglutarate 5-dioxygenase 3 isoform X2 [Agrilus planipennis]|uniref:Procollagen-lysine,2-oxoglutarate 5-dioxygenase 3 isoform X2 n=1 Tax=Agrilus planipennis TaxID=224129 RepID=A0A1W4W5Y7_AGRPL|nr:procollagen-lysine,2-oxoglutarate 5-dioxygenase 3 isoform X2 [Agrilus planipennis]
MSNYVLFLILLTISSVVKCSVSSDVPLVFTVATEETDGFLRYLKSAEEYGINPVVLGMGEEWKGGADIQNSVGGGWKINLLKKSLQRYKEQPNRIIIFTDGYDVIILDDLTTIVNKFLATGAKILFGAEGFCWPDKSLEKLYPEVKQGKRFLNSGLYMGYAPEILQLLEHQSIGDEDDDQLFFTKAYLDKELREKLQIQLDHDSSIFQNLNGAINELKLVEVETKERNEFRLKNVLTNKSPSFVHGNGFTKLKLNSLGNYIARAWNPVDGCRHCKWRTIDLTDVPDNKLPTVLVAVFVEIPTPFLEEQLMKIYKLDYPKNRIHLFLHNKLKYHADTVKGFVEKYGGDYLSIKEIKAEDGTSEWNARDLSLELTLRKKCDYYFSIDSLAVLDNPKTLRLLQEQNRTVVAPLLARYGKSWSNFWGALTTDGFYARSHDYLDIVYNTKRGLWNVPYISNCYLINSTLLNRYDKQKLSYVRDNLDADMAFCANLRDLGIFMYVSNRFDFGHLINPDTYDITIAVPDLYQIQDNPTLWEERYIHPNYSNSLQPGNTPVQPCPDVYWFPIGTERFCNNMIQMVESFGQWSDGSNQDPRLEGGYEAVPTRDIHMKQVGFDEQWLFFLKKYVLPLTEHVFTGYSHDPPRSLMNFVVRYRPDEQPSLRPHHDSSTYTINIALNRAGIDYEGGGCRFIRYNCSVKATKMGWMLMHPGKLTHYHEGLLVTNGTRYIMISFVDP